MTSQADPRSRSSDPAGEAVPGWARAPPANTRWCERGSLMPLLASMGPRVDPETREGRHEDMQLTALSKNESGRSQVRVAGEDVGWTAEEEPGSDGRQARGGPLLRLDAGAIVG